jgi:hypothetical protein
MKFEFRKSKSERIPKSKIRVLPPICATLPVADGFAGFLGVLKVAKTLASGFGGIRYSAFGFARLLVSPKPATYNGVVPK